MPKYDLKHIEARIEATLLEKGPRLGKELAEDMRDVPQLALWQACYQSRKLHVSHFASYYLRFDIRREDQVRLSPSILRDFLSFTLFGLPGQRDKMIERQGTLSNMHREISREKLSVAQSVMKQVFVTLGREIRSQLCAFIAGDLAYYLAHNEPREHMATGEMVKGSDIDIIIILSEALPEEVQERIDTEMTALKNYYMRHPEYRHEIDFICKRKSVMERQFQYTDIHDKIASKIAYESMFLGGSLTLYMEVRDAMVRTGVDHLIEADFEHALKDRKHAMHRLLEVRGDAIDDEIRSLFYFSQERVEFS
ncbi:nucleotidyltransferase domain-containing protein [Hyphomonas pacifica]|uniref:Uncharacterized protein n=1 Tax=Hyphomonas pacifica TaxID=1280941 RepID=A0A062U078_9PROT|nr:nucleotidyltransferase domain-containing protein [Hyphomonas pacifica]KCZ49357.1 hypothetical protein HY2_02950 [Hyphomonas pacifica]RAN33163.1 hypothetical protein HY3_02115 [Hyphomonas pacifica]